MDILYVGATLRLYGLWSAHNLAEKARLRVLCGFLPSSPRLPSEAKRMRGAIKTLIWCAITMNEGYVTMTSFINPKFTRVKL